MTPKEKANDLFHTITLIVLDTSFGVNKTSVKKLALHAIDEIIKTDMLIDEDTYIMTPSYLQYWQQVKQEIEKI
jgi:hypothetical protein